MGVGALQIFAFTDIITFFWKLQYLVFFLGGGGELIVDRVSRILSINALLTKMH